MLDAFQCPGDILLQAILDCASMPSCPWQAGHRLLAGAGEVQAPRDTNLLHYSHSQ